MRINDDKVLACMARLSQHSDFEVFLDAVIRPQREEATKSCINDPKPAQAQGKAQALTDIFETVTGARKAYRERSSGKQFATSL